MLQNMEVGKSHFNEIGHKQRPYEEITKEFINIMGLWLAISPQLNIMGQA
ncbi:MAG: hypothetical protein GVX96_02855 [Bacteroidetes bacterium]|jgi:hypothetical protein|nr:hypothetical protein [Bacteroidota bacterium]